jgi:hypothetical protein
MNNDNNFAKKNIWNKKTKNDEWFTKIITLYKY